MIRVELKEDEISTALARVSRALTDTTDLMRDIGDDMVQATQDRLKSGRSPDGSPFAPRSQATINHYDRLKRTYGGPLYYSGMLYNEISFAAGPDFVEWGSDRPYAAMMQFGGSKGDYPHLWGNIPARPFLGISEEDRTNILATITEWLESVTD